MSEDNNKWQITRYQLELDIIKNFLSDSEYEMSGIDFDYETSLTDLAYHAQQDKINSNKKIVSLESENMQLKSQLEQLKGNKYKEKEYNYIYEEKLNPPSYQPSLEEIMLAKAKYAFENDLWEIINYLKLYIDSLEGKTFSFPYTPELVEKEAKRSLKHWDQSLQKWDDDNDIWDCLISPTWFKTVYIDTLSDTHGGDCTGFASSCPRCHAENVFGIESTVTWGKAEGSRMEKAFFNDIKEKKALKEQLKQPSDNPEEPITKDK